MKTKVYNFDGKTIDDVDLSADIFAVKLNPTLVSQGIRVQLANRRAPIAHTKTRGEVSGGGRKPFRQKGTGNARAGSTRSPLWSGGGITFGPRHNRNFQLRFNQKMRQKAIKMLLSAKAKENKIIVLKDADWAEISTAKAEAFLAKLPIEEGKILVILPKILPNWELSVANLPYLKTIYVQNLNLADLADFDYILTTAEGLKKMAEIFSKTAKKKEA